MSKKKIYETSFEETEFIAVTAYQNDDVSHHSFIGSEEEFVHVSGNST